MKLIIVDYQRDFISNPKVIDVKRCPIIASLDKHYTNIESLQRHCTKFEMEE